MKKLWLLLPSRIGHLALNTELYLRRQAAGAFAGDALGLLETDFVANQQLLKMIERRHPVIRIKNMQEVTQLIEQDWEVERLFSNSNEYWELNNIKPQLSFTCEELESGRNLLKKMGLNDNKFVCLHSRDPAYLKSITPHNDWSYHDYRDCALESYMLAAEWLTEKGYFVLIMGQCHDGIIKINNPKIINYSDDYRTDFGDIFLPAHCEFFLGCTAGLFLVSSIFGVPTVLCNNVPYQIPPLLKEDKFIYKNSNAPIEELLFLTIEEFESNMNLRGSLVDNSAEEILAITQEMVRDLNGTGKMLRGEFERDKAFRSYWHPSMRGFGHPSSIGRDQLARLLNKAR